MFFYIFLCALATMCIAMVASSESTFYRLRSEERLSSEVVMVLDYIPYLVLFPTGLGSGV